MAVSAFDSPLLGGLVGDEEIAAVLSAETELLTMLAFEIALAEAEAAAGVIPEEAAEAIRERLSGFSPGVERIAEGVARDGVAAPAFVRQLRERVGEPHGRWVHHGATSQDLADSTLMVRLRIVAGMVEGRMEGLVTRFAHLAEAFGRNRMMGRTRMQAALPITVADRLAAWQGPLQRLKRDLPASVFAVQFGGPVGTLADLGPPGPAVRARLAEALGLADAPAWHSQRDRVVRIAGWFAAIAGALGKVGQDVALMAQNGIDEIVLEGGGGSSAMAHKHNPVDAEVLVALARYAAVELSAVQQAQVHEQERSGAAWTLEWLALPQLAMCAGGGLRIAARLLGSIRGMGQAGGGADG